MRQAPSARRWHSAGFTLIELAITIALVGILAALMVNFVQPVRSYIDSSRRAALADTADTALRRMGRDVRLALPNSARVTTSGGATYLEFMLVRTGGRYRAESDAAATNTCPSGAGSTPDEDVLSFSATDTCFKTIGNIPNIAQVTASDYVVVYNLPPGTASANAYEFAGTGGNKSQVATAVAGAGEDRINFASNTFAYDSPGRRFFIIEGPVSYVCDPVAGTLTRRWGYTISAAQPTSFSTGSSALLASGVTACTISYDASIGAQGAGLVTMALQLSVKDSRGDAETVNLYHAVHVNNLP
ncbi:MAG: prepilin-type N-terminal cleavage/methylation domain-containing protein [Betaproteobacteria bacterium]